MLNHVDPSYAAPQTQSDQSAPKNANLIAANGELAGVAAELTTQPDTESQAKAEALAHRGSDTEGMAVVPDQRDALSAGEAQVSVTRDALPQEKADLVAEPNAKAQLAIQIQQAFSRSRQEVTRLQQYIEKLEARTKETNYRQLTMAEAQIELVKELLLREPDLAAQLHKQVQLATDKQTRLAAMHSQNDQMAQENDSLQQRIQHLEVQANESSVLQQLQQQETLKAEAQIKLLTDLFMCEPGWQEMPRQDL